jgi:sodium pump decarboxylase gamma subunit
MANALMVALVGMVVVFIVLILIIFCIKIYSSLIVKNQNKGKGGTKEKQIDEPSISPNTPTNNSQVSANTDTEIVAVITAAIMAYMQDSGIGLKVRSIKRIGHTTPIWNIAGRNEHILSKM